MQNASRSPDAPRCPTALVLELCRHWPDFCDADPFENADTFADRMEAAGLLVTEAVTADDMEQIFAVERGLEPGGLKYALTERGQVAWNSWRQAHAHARGSAQAS